MAPRRVELDGNALPGVVAALVRAGRSVAWLDGDGSLPLGRFSYVGVGTMRVLGSWRQVQAALDAMTPVGDEPWPRATIALGYDLAWSMSIGLRKPQLLPRTPEGWLLEHDAMLVVDHEQHEAWTLGDFPLTLEALPHATLDRIEAEPRAVHRDAIASVLEDIARGDVYQVNLARRFTAHLDGDSLALALAMREASPVPLGAYLRGPNGALVARTMERFLSFDARTRQLETRPIKGTRSRASGQDDAAARSLLADEKERAEHAMIVDLMRNDLGRLAVPGSVIVRELMRVEPYARLSHMVSIVEARAKDEHTLSSILEATFPPGSVTGAPKLAAIERIEAYERFARGFYTGAIGHVARDGSLSLAVSIRTAQIRDGEVTYFAGGGIVEASDPDREVDETELKAKVLYDAAEILAARQH